MKTKTTIITALLMLAMASGAVAQEKWEYASVIYNGGIRKLYISINGTEFREQMVELPKDESSSFNTNPLFIEVEKLEDRGWEVMNINSGSLGQYLCHTAQLRKKKQ